MNVKARKRVSVLSLVMVCLVGIMMFSMRADAIDFALTPEPTSTLQPCLNDWIYDVAFSPDGQSILTTWGQGQFRLWETDTGELIRTFDHPNRGGQTLAFSPDGDTILTGGDDKSILWDVHTGAILYEFPRDTKDVFGTTVSFTLDGNYAVTGGFDGASLWDIQSGKVLRFFPGVMDQVLGQFPQISSNGQYALTMDVGLPMSQVYVWDMNTGEKLHTFDDGVNALFSADSQYIVTFGYNGLILWDLATFQPVHTFENERGRIYYWKFSADSQHLLMAFEGHFNLWDVKTGKLLLQFPLPLLENIYGILPDGEHLLMPQIPSDKNQHQTHLVDIWDIETGKITKTFSMGDSNPFAFQFSSDGRYVVIGTLDGEIQLWDIQQGEMIRQFCGN